MTVTPKKRGNSYRKIEAIAVTIQNTSVIPAITHNFKICFKFLNSKYEGREYIIIPMAYITGAIINGAVFNCFTFI